LTYELFCVIFLKYFKPKRSNMKTKTSILVMATVTAVISMPCTASLVTNVFDYSGVGTAPDPVSVTAALSLGAIETGTLGDGWETEVELPLGAVYTLNASMPDDGNFNIYGVGGAGLIGEVTARRVFSGTTLLTDDAYSFSLSTANAAMVNLLGSVQIEIGVTDGATDTVVASTATGTGLAGIIDVLTLFGGTDTASFNFNGPATSGGDLYIELQTGTLASLAGQTVQFNDLNITQIPEPATLVLIGLFGGGILAIRRFFLIS
jgi:hypothetical protein